jgi:L-malate glycosyltransferase
MKVLELCLSPSFGGLELYVCRAVAALMPEHEVVAVTLPESPIHERLRDAGCELHPLHTRFPRLPLRAAIRLAAIIDEAGIDVMHVNWGPDLALAALGKRLSRRRPRLVHTRHMLMNRSKRDIYHNLVYGQLDCIIAITKDMEQGLRRHLSLHSDRIRQLYCGVPAPDAWLSADERAALRAQWGFPADAFVAGIFSRLEPAKGQHLLVEAMARLHRDGAPVYGLIVGHAMYADYHENLLQQVHALGLDDYVRFLGFTDHPQRLVQACDCLALPTDRETFANIVSEAMRAGVAVIASDRGGMPEMVEHERSGLLFRSGDASDLAEQLRLLHDHPERRAALAAAGRNRADRLFSLERRFPELVDLFEDLLCR